MTFSDLGLMAALLRALETLGYTQPTPIQAQAIPAALTGVDIMGAAQTGTGKTAGFALPILQRLAQAPKARSNQVHALILTPTRELAAQVHDNIKQYAQFLPLRTAVVFGGVKINPQMMALRGGIDILVATPGRLLDLHQQNAVRFNDLKIVVLDEADRMLDMGFIRDIRKILALLPTQRQSMMFSATLSRDIRRLAYEFVKQPVEISINPSVSTAETVEHKIYPVDKARKSELLKYLIQSKGWYQALVFSRTKHGANKLVKLLQQAEINAAAIHGNKSQHQRTTTLAAFKQGKVQILVATDIAARGIDIDNLPQVVNFDLPNVPEDYVHRIGRTGRAGADGHAVSLVCAEESKQLFDIEKLLKKPIDRELIEGFEPKAPINTKHPPKTSMAAKPARPKRKPQASNKSRTSNKPNANRNVAAKPKSANHSKPAAKSRAPRTAAQQRQR